MYSTFVFRYFPTFMVMISFSRIRGVVSTDTATGTMLQTATMATTDKKAEQWDEEQEEEAK